MSEWVQAVLLFGACLSSFAAGAGSTWLLEKVRRDGTRP